MCDLEAGRQCSNYSSCPILISTLQRNYMNRTLDAIFNTLDRIEKLLENLNNGNLIMKKDQKSSN